MQKHQREIAGWLRDQYRGADIELIPGGKHPRLQFRVGDQQHQVVVAGTPGDIRAEENTRAELRRKLGTAPVWLGRARRTLDEMTKDLPMPTNTLEPKTIDVQPPKVWDVKIACYYVGANKKRHIWVLFPDEIRKTLPYVKTTQTSDSVTLTNDYADNRRAWVKYSKYAKTTIPTEEDPFGIVKTQAVEQEDGSIVVPLPRPAYRPKLEARPEVAKPKPEQATPDYPAISADEMRGILKRIYQIESSIPYRLVRLETGKLLWRAPVIEV